MAKKTATKTAASSATDMASTQKQDKMIAKLADKVIQARWALIDYLLETERFEPGDEVDKAANRLIKSADKAYGDQFKRLIEDSKATTPRK